MIILYTKEEIKQQIELSTEVIDKCLNDGKIKKYKNQHDEFLYDETLLKYLLIVKKFLYYELPLNRAIHRTNKLINNFNSDSTPLILKPDLTEEINYAQVEIMHTIYHQDLLEPFKDIFNNKFCVILHKDLQQTIEFLTNQCDVKALRFNIEYLIPKLY